MVEEANTEQALDDAAPSDTHEAFLRRTGWGIFALPGEKKRLLRSQRIVDEVLGPRPGTSA